MLSACVINTRISCYMSMGNQLIVGVELVVGCDQKKQVDDNPLDVESSTSFQATIMPGNSLSTTMGETQTGWLQS